MGYSFRLTARFFICTIPQTGQHIPRPLLHQSWNTSWNEKQLNSPMKDRSDDPSHHERTLLPELQLAPLNDLENHLINFNCTGVVPTIDEQNNFLEIGMHLLCLSYTVCHFQTSYNKIYFQTLNWISLGAGRSSEVERSLMVRSFMEWTH